MSFRVLFHGDLILVVFQVQAQVIGHCQYLAPRTLGKGDTLPVSPLPLPGFPLTRNQDLVESGRPGRRLDPFQETLHLSVKSFRIGEAGHVDDVEKDGVSSADPVPIGAAGAAQGSGQSLHGETETESLVSHRSSQGKQGAGRVLQDHARIVGGAPAAVDQPSVGNRLPQVVSQSHLSAGGDGGGHVQDQGSSACGNTHPHGIGGEAGSDPAERGRQPSLAVGVGHHDGRHPLAGDHSQVVAEAAHDGCSGAH